MLSECKIANGKHKHRALLIFFVRLFAVFCLLDTQIGLTFSVEIYYGTQYKCE